MSWIVTDLWQELEKHRAEYASQLSSSSPKGFAMINDIAARVGARWGLIVQVNFPVGARNARQSVGHENLSLLIEPGRRNFLYSTEAEVGRHLERLGLSRLEPIAGGYEGFQARLDSGRIDCLPGGVHLWCIITPQVLDFLDWIFVNAYGFTAPVRKTRGALSRLVELFSCLVVFPFPSLLSSAVWHASRAR